MNRAPLPPGHTAAVFKFCPRPRPALSPGSIALLWWATSIQLALLPLAVAVAVSKKRLSHD